MRQVKRVQRDYPSQTFRQHRDNSYATPAVSNGVMYLRTHTHLFSLGGKRP